MHKRTLLVAALATATGVLQHAWAQGPGEGSGPAPSLHLLLQYESRSIGQDGVQRDSKHTDRMFRGSNRVWIERQLPQALVADRGHGHKRTAGPHAGHAHDEAQGAPMLVSRDAKGNVDVNIVLREQHRVIDVESAHRGNVGYGGSWEAAYWLIDPKALQRMDALNSPNKGVQRYRVKTAERTTEVDWDVAGQYARRIEHRDAHGLSFQKMTATAQTLPPVMPWTEVANYPRGDYSDLLD